MTPEEKRGRAEYAAHVAGDIAWKKTMFGPGPYTGKNAHPTWDELQPAARAAFIKSGARHGGEPSTLTNDLLAIVQRYGETLRDARERLFDSQCRYETSDESRAVAGMVVARLDVALETYGPFETLTSVAVAYGVKPSVVRDLADAMGDAGTPENVAAEVRGALASNLPVADLVRRYRALVGGAR